MTTLKHAFNGKSLPGLILKIIRGRFPPVPDRYSADLRSLISAMLSPKPAHRPSVASVLGRPYIKRSIKAIVAYKPPRGTPSPDILSETPPATLPAGGAADSRMVARASDDEAEDDMDKTVTAESGIAAAAASAAIAVPDPEARVGSKVPSRLGGLSRLSSSPRQAGVKGAGHMPVASSRIDGACILSFGLSFGINRLLVRSDLSAVQGVQPKYDALLERTSHGSLRKILGVVRKEVGVQVDARCRLRAPLAQVQ